MSFCVPRDISGIADVLDEPLLFWSMEAWATNVETAIGRLFRRQLQRSLYLPRLQLLFEWLHPLLHLQRQRLQRQRLQRQCLQRPRLQCPFLQCQLLQRPVSQVISQHLLIECTNQSLNT